MMERSRTLSILGTVAATGVAVIAGIAIGDLLRDDPTLPSATPAEGAPPAVVAPSDLSVVDDGGAAVGVTVPGGEPADLGPDGSSPPRGDGLVPVPGPADPSTEAEAVVALADDAEAQQAAVAAGEAEPEAFEPPTDAAEVDDDTAAAYTPSPDELVPEADGSDFVDLCAGETPGSPPPEGFGCPVEGVAGTVLSLTSDPASELGIVLEYLVIATGSEARTFDDGPDQVAWGFCDFSGVGDGRIPVYVLASRPVDVAVAHGAPGAPDGTVEASTPDARLDNIAGMVEAYGPDMAAGFAQAQACLDVPAPDGDELELTVTATDGGGDEVTETFVVPVDGGTVDFREPVPQAAPAHPMPPDPPVREASIVGFDDGAARIVVPHDDPAIERVHVATVIVSGPGALGETCGSIQQAVFDGSRRDPRLFNWEVMPRTELTSFDPTEVFDDLFGIGGDEPDPNEGLEYQTLTWLSGADGAVYDVCVWWTGNPPTGSTFATPPIVEQRRYRVAAPDRYRVEVVIDDLELWEPVEAGQFTAEVLGRRVPFPSTDVGTDDALAEPVSLAATSDGTTPPNSELVLTNQADGASWAVMVGTRTRPCDGTEEGICVAGVSTSRLVELPRGDAVATRCLGAGCRTTLDRADQVGWARVRALVTDDEGGETPGRDSESWRVQGAGDFVGDPTALPTTPRLDTGLTALTSGGDLRQPSGTIRGSVVFDRPVTGEIRVEAVVTSDPVGCSRPPIRIGPAPTTAVSIALTGLCRDTVYSFPASVVDAAGNRAEIGGYAPLATITGVLNVRWSVDVVIDAVHVGDTVTLESTAMHVDDKAEADADGRCLRAGYHVTTPPSTGSHPLEDSLVSSSFVVGTTLDLREGCGAGDGAARTERWETTLSTDLLEALFFAAGARQEVVATVTGPLVDYTVTVRLEHIGRPTCRGGICPDRV